MGKLKKTSLNPIRNILYKKMEEGSVPVQYIRSRMKDPISLQNKIEDKSYNISNEKDVIKTVTDLAGIRLLVLYRNQIPLVDEEIWKSNKWEVTECEAYYDEERHGDEKWFKEHGFRKKAWYERVDLTEEKVGSARPILKKTKRGYSSVHYTTEVKDWYLEKYLEEEIGVDNIDWPVTKCEIQLRTIHQEAWGEFDHHIKYPEDNIDKLAERMIRRLSQLLNFAEDVVSDIRSYPANTLFSNYILSEYENKGKILSEKEKVEAVRNDFLKTAKYLGTSAPLAALRILDKYKSDDQKGPRNRVISLDYGGPEKWTYDKGLNNPLRNVYLESHKIWKNEMEGRRVTKYLVWDLEDIDDCQFDDRSLIVKFMPNIEFTILSKECFENINNVLEEEYPNIGLRSIQFFTWDIDDPNSVPIEDNEDGDSKNQAYGFYSPAKTSELTSGIVHIESKDCSSTYDLSNIDDLSRWRFATIRVLIKTLDSMKNEGLLFNKKNIKNDESISNKMRKITRSDICSCIPEGLI